MSSTHLLYLPWIFFLLTYNELRVPFSSLIYKHNKYGTVLILGLQKLMTKLILIWAHRPSEERDAKREN